MSVTSRSIAACSTIVLLSLLSPGIAHAGEQADSAEATGSSSQSCGRADRGRLLGFEPIASYPTPADARAYFESWVDFYRDFYGFAEDLTADVAYGFDAYKVTYCSIDAVLPGQDRAEPTVLTGNVSVPRKAGPLPTVAYVRGTGASYYDAPSNPNIAGDLEPRGESFEGPASSPIFAGNGFIYVAPDLTGFGDSTVPRHRYFHADSEASSTIDLLAASRDALKSLNVRRSDELFIFGWSQGGHVALAAQRALEQRQAGVTATAVIGAVFDVERFFLSGIEDETTVTIPLYVSYLLLAYDDVYDVYDKPSDVFRRPYAETVPGLLDMQHYWDDILAGLPPTSRELLKKSYFETVRTDPNDEFRVRMRENAVDRWRPEAPIRVYHTSTDEEVFYEDALVSVDRLRKRGADISVRTLAGPDHVTSWIQSMPRAVKFFQKQD